MNNLTKFINSLATDFEGIKRYFDSYDIKTIEDEHYYMLRLPAIHSEGLYPLTLELLQLLSEHKGTILDKRDNSVVCRGFPEHNMDLLSGIDGGIYAQEYINGTLIRVYHDKYTNQWRMATNGTLDAYKAFWICERSIGRLFDECLCRIYRQQTSLWMSPLIQFLSPENCYQFMLVHPEVHLHKSITRPSIFHVGTYSLVQQKYIQSRVDRLPQPRRLFFPSYYEMMQSNIFAGKKFLVYPAASADTQLGRQVFSPDSILEAEKILGHTPNLYLRWLELNRDYEQEDLWKAKDEYPIFRQIDQEVYQGVRDIASKIVVGTTCGALDEICDYFSHSNFRYESEEDVITILLEYCPPEMVNTALNLLGHIRTGDVKMPAAPTEAEQDEVDALLAYTTTAKDIESIIESHVTAFLMYEEANNSRTEELVEMILEHDPLTIERCLDDSYFLVGLIEELYQDVRNMEECY